MTKTKTKATAEFGDFQTPNGLAANVCAILSKQGLRPASVIEPTCGLGHLLFAAVECFPTVTQAVGFDINAGYANSARMHSGQCKSKANIRIEQGDFFRLDWNEIIRLLPEPILVIGNPPWVTNAHLGTLRSDNLPEKSNFQGYNGFDAMTGKSNFDISEWMLVKILEWLQGRDATMAMLCKTAVARKTLLHTWKNDWKTDNSVLFNIDAAEHFGVAVDASLLVTSITKHPSSRTAKVYENFLTDQPPRTLAFRNQTIIADLAAFERWQHLQTDTPVKWRSGIKHDCSKVMEFRKEVAGLRNGLGELVELEDTFLFPMLKSSDVANGGIEDKGRWMLVPQRCVGESTTPIANLAPKTWAYLNLHAHLLERRGSSIYKEQCAFSIFGVGEYSFAPWKVAISGFYKRLNFMKVGPLGSMPVMLDDTCYFLPCKTEEEATTLSFILNSTAASDFFKAFIFWDAKRPITVDLLRRLSLKALAKHLKIDLDLLGTWSTNEGMEGPPKRRRKKSSGLEPRLWANLAEPNAYAP